MVESYKKDYFYVYDFAVSSDLAALKHLVYQFYLLSRSREQQPTRAPRVYQEDSAVPYQSNVQLRSDIDTKMDHLEKTIKHLANH